MEGVLTLTLPHHGDDKFYSSHSPYYIIVSRHDNKAGWGRALSMIEMMAIDGYVGEEERGREYDIWKEIRENYGK